MIWNPDSINLFVQLTLNHFQHCSISFLASHPLMRERTTEITVFGLGQAGAQTPPWQRLPALWAQAIPLHTHSRGSQKLCGSTKPHRKENYWFRELTQGTPHQLCCVLKRCWIMRWTISHVILLATHLSRIVSISYLPFFHSKFIDDRNIMSWAMPSWNILIVKSPWNNCKDFEARRNKTSSECFQVVITFVREDKWTGILMLELRWVQILTLAVTKPQSGFFSLWGFVTAFTWHLYHSILISR